MFDLEFDPIKILLTLPGIMIGIALHGFIQAYAANKLGDNTAKEQGRLTIDPLPHFDLFGLFFLIIFNFGWPKSVPVNPRNFKRPQRDSILVALVGPMTNLAIAFFSVILIKLLILSRLPHLHALLWNGIYAIAVHTIWINLMLFVFNLLPIYPLDGYDIFFYLAHYSKHKYFLKLRQYSRFILILIIITPLASFFLEPIVSSLYDGLFALFRL